MKKFKLLAASMLITTSMSITAFAGDWNNVIGLRQYKKDDGSFATSEWVHHDNSWYHFDENGYVQAGWYKDEKNKWYFSRYDGVMQTGLVKIDNIVYYLEDTGALFEGEKEIYGTTYKFTVNGIDGYAPGVPKSRTFGIDGGQSLGDESSGGGGGGGPSSDTSGSNQNDSSTDSPLAPGLSTGPGQ